jgi:hypothetical protein
MSFPVGRLILLGIIASLPACIIVNDFKANLKAYETKSESEFPYRHSSSDFIVAWNAVQAGKLAISPSKNNLPTSNDMTECPLC